MKIILTLLSPEDLAAIPSFIAQFQKSPIEGIWIIHNPDLGVNGSAAAEKYEKEIAQLSADMAEASHREDFVAASELKTKRDAKTVERDLAVRQGWTSVSRDALSQGYARTLAGFNESVAKNVMATALCEVFSPDRIHEALHGLRAGWPVPLPHGSYVMGGPRAFINGEVSAPAPTPRLIDSLIAVGKEMMPDTRFFDPAPLPTPPDRLAAAKAATMPPGQAFQKLLASVREGYPLLSRSQLGAMSRAEAEQIVKKLGGMVNPGINLASLKKFIESKGIVKAAQPTHFNRGPAAIPA